MAKIKTSELIGAALDWAVAKCEGLLVSYEGYFDYERDKDIVTALHIEDNTVFTKWSPSTDWAQGGPLVEKEKIETVWLPSTTPEHKWGARKPSLGGINRTYCMDGPTPLIAAMRTLVASKLGDEIEIPEELL